MTFTEIVSFTATYDLQNLHFTKKRIQFKLSSLILNLCFQIKNSRKLNSLCVLLKQANSAHLIKCILIQSIILFVKRVVTSSLINKKIYFYKIVLSCKRQLKFRSDLKCFSKNSSTKREFIERFLRFNVTVKIFNLKVA